MDSNKVQAERGDSSSSTMGPIFIVSGILGLFPVNAFGQIKGLLWIRMLITLTNGLCVTCVVAYKTMPFSFLASFLFWLKHTLTCICIVWHLITVVRRKNDLKTLVVHITKHDVKFNAWELTATFFFISVDFSLHLTRLLESTQSSEELIIYVGLNFYDYCILIINGQFCSLISVLAGHFKAARESIRPIEPAINRVHELIALSETIGEIYSVQLLITLVLIFLNIVNFSYGLCEFFALGKFGFNEASCIRVTEITSQLFVWFSLLWYTCGKCSAVKNNVEAFNAELFRLMRENKALCNNETLYLYVTMKPTVQFTACGFFNLGYSMVTSIIAAATTYLVILIQFSTDE